MAAKGGKAGAVARPAPQYPWPGNVRELEHAIERAAIVASGSAITLRDLPPDVRDAIEALPAGELNLERQEHRLIREALARTGGNRRKAAAALGISTVSLWRKLRKEAPALI